QTNHSQAPRSVVVMSSFSLHEESGASGLRAPSPQPRQRAAICRTGSQKRSGGREPQRRIISGASMCHKNAPVKRGGFAGPTDLPPFPPRHEIANVKNEFCPEKPFAFRPWGRGIWG